MALDNRSRPLQIVYLILAFVGLMGLIGLLVRWGL